MTSDLVWDLVFVFKDVAALTTSSPGGSASLTLWKLAWVSRGVRGAWERLAFPGPMRQSFNLRNQYLSINCLLYARCPEPSLPVAFRLMRTM